MTTRILIDMPVHEQHLQELQSMDGIHVNLLPRPEVSPETPARMSRRTFSPPLMRVFCTMPPNNFDAMRGLRWIQISSAGYSQLFGLNLVERGIRATNARGCFDVPIAESNLAMMVNLARDLRQMVRNQDAQVWNRDARFQSEIRGLTVGLWGDGGIGRETARLLRALGDAYSCFVATRSGQGGRRVFRPRHWGSRRRSSGPGVLKGQEHEFLSGLEFSNSRYAVDAGIERYRRRA